MFTVLSNTRNSHLYLIVALATSLVAVLAFAVVPSIVVFDPGLIPVSGSEAAFTQYLRGEKVIYAQADLSWPPRPVIVPVTGAEEDQPYIMDSATRSYIAWGGALQAAGNLGDSGACSNMTPENIFDGIDNNLDSATRSYIAWGLALQAKDEIRALCR